MKPAPSTPIFEIFEAGTSAGRRASLFSSCIETKSERIMALASLVCRTWAKWRDSTRSAASIGSSRPS